MTDTIKEYNSYLQQIEMIIHPNLYNAFLKIHNKILDEEIEKAKTYKPDNETIEILDMINSYKRTEDKGMKKFRLEVLIKHLKKI